MIEPGFERLPGLVEIPLKHPCIPVLLFGPDLKPGGPRADSGRSCCVRRGPAAGHVQTTSQVVLWEEKHIDQLLVEAVSLIDVPNGLGPFQVRGECLSALHGREPLLEG